MPKSSRRSRGDGGLYQRADGMWVGSVELGYGPTGTRRRKVVTSTTQAGALAKLRAVRRDVEKFGSVPTASGTVEDWLDRWLADIAAPRVKPRTLDGYRDKVRIINAAIGNVRLDKLTASHVRTMQKYAASNGRNSTTALHCHRVLSLALRDGMREGVVLRNVCELTDAPAQAVTDVQPLTTDEAKALLRHVADDPLAARWALALLYGVRQGEALGLTWAAVDFANETIDLEWQLQRLTWRHGCAERKPWPCKKARGGYCPKRHLAIPAGVEYRPVVGAWVLTRPKRGKRRRVPLIPPMAAFLRTRMDVARLDPNPYGLVFARPDGMPFSPSMDSKAWHAHLDAAGLPSIRLHDARHTAATLLLELGVDAEIIAAILGHSDIVTTRGYQTISLALQRQALEGLGRAITG